MARYLGIDLDPTQLDRLGVFAKWLVEEAIPAGGLGPVEIDRIERRHIADSLLFAAEIPSSTELVWDLGSGVGLPGIPLAIILPETKFLLIDRSGRRIDLIRRAVRILDLRNCQITQGEIEGLRGVTPVIVSRASLPPTALARVAVEHLQPDGVVIAGGSWVAPPHHAGWETKEIPGEVLDQPVWLLIMRRA